MDNEVNDIEDDDAGIKIYLRICTVVFTITGIPLFLMMPFSFFLLGYSWLVFICFILTPISMIICGPKMWACYERKQYNKAIIWSSIPVFALFLLFYF